jgi:hypothetical protein
MRIAIVLAGLLLSTAAAQAQYMSRAAASGTPIKLLFANSTNPDCTTLGRPTVRLIRAPQHGRVHITPARDFPTFSPANIRSACNARRVPGMLVRYVSQRGYVGMDYLSVEVIFATGTLQQRHYSINVR